MKSRLMPYLQIMRFPNWFTAWADVIAGYIIVSGSDIKVFTLLGLIVATSGIYAGGCALNDLCDRKIDSKERPSRPIPSGEISIFEAGFLTIICFGVGLASAFYIGYKVFFVASVLVILVVLYDGFLKKLNIIGPLNMGACRALNLLLGMSPAITVTFFLFLLPFFSLVYVFSLTVLSRFEVGGGVEEKGWVVFAGWLLVLVGLFCVFWTEPKIMSALLLCMLALSTGPFLVRALIKPKPAHIQKAVKMLIIGIPVLDAVYVSGTVGFSYAVPVLLCIIPSLFLSRYFYVT